jgi:hypothetical protein
VNRVDGEAPLGRRAHLEDSPDVVEDRDEHLPELAGDEQEVAGDLRKLAVDVRDGVGERPELRKSRDLRTDVRCKRLLRRKPLAERLGSLVKRRCERFPCREPLAERLRPFVERLHAFEEERCEWFVRREPLAGRL